MSKVIVEIDADLQDLVPQFVENRKKDLESLQQLLETCDMTGMAHLTHKIKGAAAGYGFNELSDYAALMEKASKANDLDALKDLLSRMRTHFLNVEVRYVAM